MLNLKLSNEVFAHLDNAKVRETLTGQRRAIEQAEQRKQLQVQIELAEVQFGLSMTKEAIDEQVIATIRPRFRKTRYAMWTHLDNYSRSMIPDAAIARYVEAKESGHFNGFYVINPEYRANVQEVRDPWLVGHISGTGTEYYYGRIFNDSGSMKESILLSDQRYIVLGYWD